MSYDFDTRRFAAGGAKLAAAHLNHALDGRAAAQALAVEVQARISGDADVAAQALADAEALVAELQAAVAAAGYVTTATAPVRSVNGKTGNVVLAPQDGGTGVGTFNGRDGAVTLGPDDVASALPSARLITLINAALPLLPTVQPAAGGGLWNNGGVLCVA